MDATMEKLRMMNISVENRARLLLLLKKDLCVNVWNGIEDIETHATTQMILYAFLSLFILIVNILLVLGLFKTIKRFQNPQKMFIAISIIDGLIGALLIPYQIYMLYRAKSKELISCLQNSVHGFLMTFLVSVTFMLILTVSLHRYFYIAYSLSFKKWENILMKIMAVLNWIIPLPFCIWHGYARYYGDNESRAKCLLSFSVFESVVLLAILVLNFMLWRFIHKSSEETASHCPNITSQVEKKSKKVSKTITIISVSLVTCYIPTVIAGYSFAYHFWPGSNQKMSSNLTQYMSWSLIPTILNSGLNSLIFIWRNQKIVNYLKRLITCKRTEKQIDFNSNRSSRTESTATATSEC